ncbi:hypothetical protein [Archaeoglobus profundus]|uniref:Uracil-DNA glycosylase-like domain-containing protein n=1 Tax=Archaeoglobus profundus (strain DSM 5631 / JCM 9629 / NBRC 100127 / Av18) TaxID=572546 RepID=D2RGV1_ARCPA|nr:hypothetical protein [Archaeoglobus profundus]ADB57526.1 hypothetical protein Arcpr_0460 [Archaeoglobus profundus DSM 5631]
MIKLNVVKRLYLRIEESEKDRIDENYREIRENYNPMKQNIKIKVLFIGESPAGATFFYCANSNLYFATKEAFEKAYSKSITNFLDCFKYLGCYLIDVYNKPDTKAKSPCGWVGRQEKGKLIPNLANQISQLNPYFIIVIHERVCCWAILSAKEALKKLKKSKTQPNFNLNDIRCLPFPRCDCREVYIDQLAEIIKKELIPRGIFPKKLPQPPC